MVCLSLKSLIEGSKGNGNTLWQFGNWDFSYHFLLLGTDQAEIGRFSKNYLPILFNLYTNDHLEGEPPREPILECIAAFLSITEQKVLSLNERSIKGPLCIIPLYYNLASNTTYIIITSVLIFGFFFLFSCFKLSSLKYWWNWEIQLFNLMLEWL